MKMFAIYLILVFISFISLNNCNVVNNKYNYYNEVKNCMNLTGKVALVTGSGNGIAAKTVRLFSYLGAQVVVTDIIQDKIEIVAKECVDLSPYKLEADLAKSEDIKNLVAKTIKKYKNIDILVNNAAIPSTQRFNDKNYMNGINKIIAVNVLAPIELIHESAQFLKQTNGTVINIASTSGIKPSIGMSAYGMSKAALIMLTKSLSLELGPHTRVNTISPSMVIGTSIFDDNTKNLMTKHTLPTIPLNRMGYPIDIAKGIVFLASPLAEWITGVNLEIIGGRYGTLPAV